MSRSLKAGLSWVVLATLAGCAPDYSPDIYASSAVQQANKVEPAIVVGFRQVKISANGTVGAVTGGAAGGILGAQTGSSATDAALGSVAGSVVGSMIGKTIEHATGDTVGWEYIVRKPNGDLLSVTQREEKPISLGQKVLVITGSQARIIADYSVIPEPPPPPPPAPAAREAVQHEAVQHEVGEKTEGGQPAREPAVAAPVVPPVLTVPPPAVAVPAAEPASPNPTSPVAVIAAPAPIPQDGGADPRPVSGNSPPVTLPVPPPPAE